MKNVKKIILGKFSIEIFYRTEFNVYFANESVGGLGGKTFACHVDVTSSIPSRSDVEKI